MGELIKDIGIVDDREVTQEVRVSKDEATDSQRKVYIESYGCQMNFSDSEIVASILAEEGFGTTSKIEEADLVFLNTCSIRDKAEQSVRNRLKHINKVKEEKPGMTIGVLGCMAERLKAQLLVEAKIVDIVAGTDAYRDLPQLVSEVDDGQKAVNVFLSRGEVSADVTPVRLHSKGSTAVRATRKRRSNWFSFC